MKYHQSTPTDPMDGGAGSAAAGRAPPPSRRATGSQTSVRGLHQVRQRAETSLPSDTGLTGVHAAGDAQDNEECLRTQSEQAAARLGRLLEL